MEKRTFSRDRPSNGGGYGGNRSGREDRPRSGGFGGGSSSGFGGGSSGSGSFGGGFGGRPSRDRSFGSKPREDFKPRGDRPAYGGDRPSFGDRKPFGPRRDRDQRESPVVSMELINGGITPKYMTSGASGMDIHSNISMMVESNKIVHVSTGIIINSLPPRVILSVRSRSSLAKDGLLLLSPTLLTNENVTHELVITFFNVTDKPIEINAGDRIAQIIFATSEKVVMEIADNLNETKRDQGGFGSTNKNDQSTDNEEETSEE